MENESDHAKYSHSAIRITPETSQGNVLGPIDFRSGESGYPIFHSYDSLYITIPISGFADL